MALFAFTALRQGGEQYSGEKEAPTKQAVIDALKLEGSVPLYVEKSSSHKTRKGFSFNMQLTSGVKMTDKITFARNLSSMITAGLSLSRALLVIEKQTKKPGFKKVLNDISEHIRQGRSLHEALAAHPKIFSALFVAMTRAGEESGTLAKSLDLVSLQMERNYELLRKVRGAMIYPAIVVTVMIAIGVLLMVFVVPTLAATFASLKTELPLPTRIIIGTSNFFITHTVIVILITILVVVCFVFAMRSNAGKRLRDRVFAHLPVIGVIVAKVNAARTARTLASLLSSGVAALSALEITEEVVQNSRFKPIITEAHAAVEKGKPLSETFIAAERIYPVMFSEMMAVGEETGDLPGMLSRVADFYEGEVSQQTKDLSTIIEPVLMVMIGIGVGFFAISMIMPIYSLSNSF